MITTSAPPPPTVLAAHRGRNITQDDIGFIRELIAAHPEASRRRLSALLCEAWDWRQPNGCLRDMVCRGLMLELHRAGLIELPAKVRAPKNPLTQRPAPPALDEEGDLFAQAPLECSLRELGPLQIEQVRRTRAEGLVAGLLARHHYLGYNRPVGEHLKYLVYAAGQPIAALIFSSAPRHLAPRDRFIGWNAAARRRNLHLIAINSRYLIMPWVRIPHLASHLLARMARRLSADWQRVYGHPLQARIHELERVRCGLCGKVFTATAPEEARGPKYDPSAGAMVALLKYGTGVPFNRLAGLQESLELPLPAATQWEIVEGVADQVYPAVRELWRQGAQGEVVHNDDTPMKILELMAGHKHDQAPMPGEAWKEDAIGMAAESAAQDASAQNQTPPTGADRPPAEAEPAPPPNEKTPSRTGVFTSAIISRAAGHTIALFATGLRHAGENLERLLELREAGREQTIQMCDALSRNVPKSFQTILANCLAHGRRRFVDVVASFPEECRRVLLTLREVYRRDAHCHEQGLSPPERLAYHQEHSGPLMQELRTWMEAQLEERLVEPNSGLGEAIRYMIKHWEPLTLFLRVPGAPLDNNICERALKKAIRHRINSLFFKTEHGAAVGDLFMSLIHTCHMNRVNPFAYLVQLQRHAADLRRNPAAWMPWNYQTALAAREAAPAS